MSRITAGSPTTLGVTVTGEDINVAVHAPDAEAVAICLFDTGDQEIARFRLPARTGPVHHGHIAGVPQGTRYGLRAYGPWDPANGHRFNPSKLLMDPWATAIDRAFRLDPLLFDRDGPRPEDTAALVPKAIIGTPPVLPVTNRPKFDWDRQVIYELHVRGFTMTNPAIPPAIRGTFAGLAHPASISHLTRLGISTVELMPSAAWVDERHLSPLNLSNYWGYNPIAFLAPDPRLAPGGWPEVRAAVDALHDAGLNVILDVVLNHSGESDELGPTLSMRGLDNAGYYRLANDKSRYVDDAGCGNILAMDRPHVLRLAMDALRAWAQYGGIDGFRLDLATTLGRRDSGFDPHAPFLAAAEQDPILSHCVMIAEPWDIGYGGYQLGNFPPRWGEWNDHFRDSIRRFWRGDAGLLGDFTTRFAGSADIFPRRPLSRGINFITAHDGFTLADLVSYETKHNQANGEDNRDGTTDNLSWNNGAEGPSSDPTIQTARTRDTRALLATLLLSRGTPMLSMGDELGRTQHGNNNAYALDNAASWIDWPAADETLIDHTAALIALRHALAPLFDGRPLKGQPADDEVTPDVTWHTRGGRTMSEADWNNPANRTLIAVLFANGIRAALIFNADATPFDVALPPPQPGHNWKRLLGDERPVTEARSVTVFREEPYTAPSDRSDHSDRSEKDFAEPAPSPPSRPGVSRSAEPAPSPPSQPAVSRSAEPALPHSSWPGVSRPSTLRRRSEDSHDHPGHDGEGTPLPPPHLTYTANPGTSPTDAELDHLAELAGINPIWWDVDGGHHQVPTGTKRALLTAMRLPAATRGDLNDSIARLTLKPALPPVLTARQNQPIQVPLGHPRPAWITLHREDGSLERFHTHGDDPILPPQPIGRLLILNEDQPDHPCHLTVAPDACYLPPSLLSGERRYGIAAHLYTLRSPGDQGIGDFTTLARLATEAARAGAATIGLNPLHALFPHDRHRTSPYQPSDRRFLDPIYIDVSSFPNGAAIPSQRGPVDYPAVWNAKRTVLQAAFNPDPNEIIAPALHRFATFEAIAESLETSDWRQWPPELRHPDDPAVAAFAAQHWQTVAFHAYLQRLADQQLAAAAQTGLSLGFYRDLAVGAAPDGAEAWSAQDSLMHGVSVGAPPDPIATQGQNWSLPPPDPLAMRRDGYTAFRELLTANMRHAGALRIDHVMGLRRLFIIPDGASGADGAYVTYPLQDLIAQVALESHRASCLVVGEDLGTVPEGMSETLVASNILSYSVLWFQRQDNLFKSPAEWRRLAAACVSTHDLPTLAGWWNGTDITEKRALSILNDPGAEQARTREKTELIALLQHQGLLTDEIDPAGPMPTTFAAAIHAFVSATPSLLALVQADDLAGETIGVNLPGTDKERPNWQRRLEVDVQDLFQMPLAQAILHALSARAASETNIPFQ